MKARYEAHANSEGDFSLILDSTRPLSKDALKILDEKYKKFDMTVIREESLGNGFWVDQAKLLKIISEKQFYRVKYGSVAFLLPRFYNSELLTQGFKIIKAKMGNLFNEVGYGEHHIIFDECRKISQNIGMTDETLLSHYEDSSLMRTIRKYYWYGKSQKKLKELEDSSSKTLSTHRRKGIVVRDRIKILPISIAKTAPFMLGYMF
ncbi:MAG: hypothetical protein QXU18_03025 [Thermoplasmatales archaeon]